MWSTQRLRYAQRLHSLLRELAETYEEERRNADAERLRLEDLALIEKHLAMCTGSSQGAETVIPDELIVMARDASLVPLQAESTRTVDIAKRARFLAAEVERTEGGGLTNPEASVPEHGVVSWASMHGSIVLLAHELESSDSVFASDALSDFGTHKVAISFADTTVEPLAERTSLLLALSGIAIK